MKIVYRVLMLFIVIIALSVIASKWGFGAWRLYVVESGSMEPAILTGSVVLVKPVSEYKLNDVVTYAQSGRRNVPVTHRVVKIEKDNIFTTKGDANKDSDGEQIPYKDVIGKVIFSLPFLGYIVAFARTIYGYLLLVILPGGIVIFAELTVILKEVSKLKLAKQNAKIATGWQRLKLACILSVITSLFFNNSSAFTQGNITDRISTSAVIVAGSWPVLDLSYSQGEHKISFKASNISNFTSLSYVLTYKTAGIPRGDVGNFPTGGQSQVSRDSYTGSCSEGDCSNYTNIHDIELKVTLTDGSGNSKEITKTL